MSWYGPNHKFYQSYPYLPLPNQYHPRPQPTAYPPNDPARFRASAETSMRMAEQAKRLLSRIQSDERFASKLRNAAQMNNHDEVRRLINQIEMQVMYKVSYTPDGIKIKLTPQNEQKCAKMVIDLCW